MEIDKDGVFLTTAVLSQLNTLSLPEINTVQADMTRTSLVDGITPFCFTCANNIRLVCGKCKETGI